MNTLKMIAIHGALADLFSLYLADFYIQILDYDLS